MDLSIIIPAFNEEERITQTLFEIQHYLATKNMHYEIIVVDDGSSDATLATVIGLTSEIPQLDVEIVHKNKGKGHAVKKGILRARGNICIFTDADGSTPIHELDALIAPIQRQEAKISIGSRYLKTSIIEKNQPKYRRVWSRFSNRIIQRTILHGIVDPHCGFKAFEKQTAKQLFSRSRVCGWSFDLEILAMAQSMALTISEHPVRWINDDRSKGSIRHLPREVLNVIQIKKQLKKYGEIESRDFGKDNYHGKGSELSD